MPIKRFFLALVVLPHILLGLHEQECNHLYEEVRQDWKRASLLIEEVGTVGAGEIEKKVELLTKAIATYRGLMDQCTVILEDIEKHSKKEWRKELKKKCKWRVHEGEKFVEEYGQYLSELQTFLQGRTLYKQGCDIAEKAAAMKENCLRRLDNMGEVVRVLNEVGDLYDEASRVTQKALEYIYVKEDRELITHNVMAYEKGAREARDEAANWPGTIVKELEAFASLSNVPKRRESGLIETSLELSKKEFQEREQERREFFFAKTALLLHPDLFLRSKRALALDGQIESSPQTFTLFTEHYTRFFLEREKMPSALIVKVYENGELQHIETIEIPQKDSLFWHKYLIEEGMVHIPQTFLSSEFGFHLRLKITCNPLGFFSLILAQKATTTHYTFSIFLDEEEVYQCRYVLPPPWQLSGIAKPAFPKKERNTEISSPIMTGFSNQFDLVVGKKIPLLDQFVEEMKRDPLLLAEYVYNEIALANPFIDQELPAIHRGPLTSFLDKRGSPWEQCHLLVYLLREAGCEALYAEGELGRPQVILHEGDGSIFLAPWKKEMQIEEGVDLYNFMPDEFSTSDRFLFRYLQNDERIFNKVGLDGDSSPATLFIRFVEEELKKKNLSLKDVGTRKRVIKRSFASWKDYPKFEEKMVYVLPEPLPNKFGQVMIEIFSSQNPGNKIEATFSLAALNTDIVSIESDSDLFLRFGDVETRSIPLEDKDHTIGVTVAYKASLGSNEFSRTQTLLMERGGIATLCFHFGGSTPESTAFFYDRYLKEKDEKKHTCAFLAFLGAAYFEKCGAAEEVLANLHKAVPSTTFAFGLAKISRSRLPSVDMMWTVYKLPQDLAPILVANQSFYEHRILEEIFEDPSSISTVRLLQLANKEILVFSPSSFSFAEKFPEAATELYFPHIKDLNLRKLQKDPQWGVIRSALEMNPYSYAFMTPRPISSLDGTYHEMGSFILSPNSYYALISNNLLLQNGGLGTCKVESNEDYYKTTSITDAVEIKTDVRQEHKSSFDMVNDPVDVISGAFYIDEVDFSFGGLQIRRNYNSQNPVDGILGCGWKLSLNPFLVQYEGKLFAAEEDGTMIAYRFSEESARWEVFPEDNRDLGTFRAYIENSVLYAPDGSKRIFEGERLIKKIDARGHVLEFLYSDDRLVEIRSSNGDFCGLHYGPSGRISEIYAKDGRRISYRYNYKGDLIQVVLPNSGTISYEYNEAHQIIQETKPEGAILQNVYDDKGRVIEQRSPVGYGDRMVTSASFEYTEEATLVRDGRGGSTTYTISNGNIDKIVDPEGNEIIQVWSPSCKRLLSSTDKRGLTLHYEYDEKGNVIEISFNGISKFFKYNELNLCIEEEALGIKTITTYDEQFPYLPKRIEKICGDRRVSFTQFTYNKLGEVIEENHSGARVLWKYDAKGRPIQKIQLTGTEDLDVTTDYEYNNLGQCIQKTTKDAIEKMSYDISGNCLESFIYSPGGDLLSATYRGFNLNNQLLWEQGANSQDIIHYEYNAAGLLKAFYKALEDRIAYTLYEYDECGNLIEEVNPLGAQTTYEYDLLGRVICVSKGGLSTHYSYEPGGLVASTTTPSGAVTSRIYTTNGLREEEIYPDGTKNHFVYDGFGRVVEESRNGITFAIHYDDANRRVIRNHEISEFDARGNLIRFTDSAGYLVEKTYDGLNRLKTETSPTGETTFWSYQGDRVICTLPSGEEIVHRYEAGQVAETTTFSKEGVLLAQTLIHYDPEKSVQTITEGNVVTITEVNTLGLPVHVQKGDIAIAYEYDAIGQCIASIDGEGRTTRYKFDALGRMIQKELPDGTLLRYEYDRDSNLIEYQMPQNCRWRAMYDGMGRKLLEELVANGSTSQHWDYTYKGGYLREIKDPLGRIHNYRYDEEGRLVEEKVGEWQRLYTYDSRGLVTSLHQKKEDTAPWYSFSNVQESLVERSYDASARLIQETIFLNGKLLQETHQIWDASTRSLHVDSHERTYTYQNGHLVHLSTNGLDLAYEYSQSGTLVHKETPFGSVAIHLTPADLPDKVYTPFAKEALEWDCSGRALYHNDKKFTYTQRGHLQSAGQEHFAFNSAGIRIKAPHTAVQVIDPFGRVTHETGVEITYDAMGQVISQNGRTFEWDPWGKLICITDDHFTWEASYDGLGRRLQTRTGGKTMTSLYDPEEEFQEIGISIEGQTFWKFHGPTSCDAIIDENGNSVGLFYDILGHLTHVASRKGLFSIEPISVYGPQILMPLEETLIAYAKSLTWHSKAQDPTGLIWMGARYYDPRCGRFLSPDPVGYPIQMDLFTYANGDPVNFRDPDGRFASSVYEQTRSVDLNAMEIIDQFNLAKVCTNRLMAWAVNEGFYDDYYYQVGISDLPNGGIGFINGINNTMTHARASAVKLSEYGGGVKINGVLNRTYMPQIDVQECIIGRLRFHSPPVQLLKNQWEAFISNKGPDAKFLQICHSGGAIHVKNALLTSPESIRKGIIVVAIAPGEIIPSSLCYRATNYVSQRDIVPWLDIIGIRLYSEDVRFLESHKDAPFFDHSILSPTYEIPLEDQILNYINHYGGKK